MITRPSGGGAPVPFAVLKFGCFQQLYRKVLRVIRVSIIQFKAVYSYELK